jgi:hypothetical protein
MTGNPFFGRTVTDGQQRWTEKNADEAEGQRAANARLVEGWLPDSMGSSSKTLTIRLPG